MGSVEKVFLNNSEMFFVKPLCWAPIWLIDKRLSKPTWPTKGPWAYN
jgi:hypothetical protein